MAGVHKTAADLQRDPLCPECHTNLAGELVIKADKHQKAPGSTPCPSCGVVVYVERFTMYHTYTLGESNDQ